VLSAQLIESLLVGEPAGKRGGHGRLHEHVGQFGAVFGQQCGGLVVGGQDDGAPAQLAADVAQLGHQGAALFAAGRRPHESSGEVAGERDGDEAVLGDGVDRHAEAAQAADRRQGAVVQRVVADLDDEQGQAAVEVRTRGQAVHLHRVDRRPGRPPRMTIVAVPGIVRDVRGGWVR
jgi:hypothetical protein